VIASVRRSVRQSARNNSSGMFHMNHWFLLNKNSNPSLYVAMGFGIGGVAHCLFLLPWKLVPSIMGMGIAGTIGGAILAHRSIRRRSATLIAIGYGLGFLIGGFISVSMLGLLLETRGDSSFSFFYFYPWYMFGFCIAGATGAAFTRPRLISVANSTICFLVGSAIGGIVVGVLLGSPIEKPYIAAIGLFITYLVGGALTGAVSEFSDEGDE